MEVQIDQIKPNSYNPKSTEDNLEKFEAIKKGIEETGNSLGDMYKGMQSPIDVRELEDGSYEIIDGYHRWRACKELGWTKIPIVSWGKLSDSQAKKLTILKEKARIPLDILKTSQMLSELAKDTAIEDLARQVGYQLPQLEEDLKLAKFDWGQYKGGDGDGENGQAAEELKTLSIIMTASQYSLVQNAINKVKEEAQTESEARAVELICAEYLSGH